MAVDLKIEVFSNEFFHFMWEKMFGVTTFREPRKRTDKSSLPEISEFTEEISSAVLTRVSLFNHGYQQRFERDYYMYSKSGTDFYLYIDHCYFKFSDNLNIFDRVLLVCSVISVLGGICLAHGNGMYIDIAPLCCAMFMDVNLKDEFYDSGGWNGLKRHASIYKNVLKDVELRNDDLENIFRLVYAVGENYNMDLLLDYFHKRHNKIYESGEDYDFCAKCSLLSTAFMTLESRENFETNKIIESILQLTLYMHSLDVQSADISNVSKELEKLSVHPKNSDSGISVSKTEKLRGQESEKFSSGDSKDSATLRLFRKLFNDPNEIKPEVDGASAAPVNAYVCALCLNPVIESSVLVKQKQSDNENRIASLILKEIELCLLEVSSQTFESQNPGNKYSDVSIKEGESENKRKENDRKKEIEFVHLRLFIALGTEPVKSLILKELKICKSSGDVQSTQEESNTSKKRKKRQRKKKNTQSADN